MKNIELGKRFKLLRMSKGLSQEQLAEEADLSLRTIQRIENGETEPRGDSLQKITRVLNIAPDEILDWGLKEDKEYLALLNLSALTFIAHPLFGIFLPLVLWFFKKDKVQNANEVGKNIVNFQITWSIVFYITHLLLLGKNFYKIDIFSFPLPSSYLGLGIFVLLYLYNIIMIIRNLISTQKDRQAHYIPSISVFR